MGVMITVTSFRTKACLEQTLDHQCVTDIHDVHP